MRRRAASAAIFSTRGSGRASAALDGARPAPPVAASPPRCRPAWRAPDANAHHGLRAKRPLHRRAREVENSGLNFDGGRSVVFVLAEQAEEATAARLQPHAQSSLQPPRRRRLTVCFGASLRCGRRVGAGARGRRPHEQFVPPEEFASKSVVFDITAATEPPSLRPLPTRSPARRTGARARRPRLPTSASPQARRRRRASASRSSRGRAKPVHHKVKKIAEAHADDEDEKGTHFGVDEDGVPGGSGSTPRARVGRRARTGARRAPRPRRAADVARPRAQAGGRAAQPRGAGREEGAAHGEAARRLQRGAPWDWKHKRVVGVERDDTEHVHLSRIMASLKSGGAAARRASWVAVRNVRRSITAMTSGAAAAQAAAEGGCARRCGRAVGRACRPLCACLRRPLCLCLLAATVVTAAVLLFVPSVGDAMFGGCTHAGCPPRAAAVAASAAAAKAAAAAALAAAAAAAALAAAAATTALAAAAFAPPPPPAPSRPPPPPPPPSPPPPPPSPPPPPPPWHGQRRRRCRRARRRRRRLHRRRRHRRRRHRRRHHRPRRRCRPRGPILPRNGWNRSPVPSRKSGSRMAPPSCSPPAAASSTTSTADAQNAPPPPSPGHHGPTPAPPDARAPPDHLAPTAAATLATSPRTSSCGQRSRRRRAATTASLHVRVAAAGSVGLRRPTAPRPRHRSRAWLQPRERYQAAASSLRWPLRRRRRRRRRLADALRRRRRVHGRGYTRGRRPSNSGPPARRRRRRSRSTLRVRPRSRCGRRPCSAPPNCRASFTPLGAVGPKEWARYGGGSASGARRRLRRRRRRRRSSRRRPARRRRGQRRRQLRSSRRRPARRRSARLVGRVHAYDQPPEWFEVLPPEGIKNHPAVDATAAAQSAARAQRRRVDLRDECRCGDVEGAGRGVSRQCPRERVAGGAACVHRAAAGVPARRRARLGDRGRRRPAALAARRRLRLRRACPRRRAAPAAVQPDVAAPTAGRHFALSSPALRRADPRSPHKASREMGKPAGAAPRSPRPLFPSASRTFRAVPSARRRASTRSPTTPAVSPSSTRPRAAASSTIGSARRAPRRLSREAAAPATRQPRRRERQRRQRGDALDRGDWSWTEQSAAAQRDALARSWARRGSATGAPSRCARFPETTTSRRALPSAFASPISSFGCRRCCARITATASTSLRSVPTRPTPPRRRIAEYVLRLSGWATFVKDVGLFDDIAAAASPEGRRRWRRRRRRRPPRSPPPAPAELTRPRASGSPPPPPPTPPSTWARAPPKCNSGGGLFGLFATGEQRCAFSAFLQALIATACLRRPPHKSFPLDGWHVTMALESLLADCILPRARRRPALGFRRAVLASSAVDGALRRHARQLRASARPIRRASSAVCRSRPSSPLSTRVPRLGDALACRHRDHLRRGARAAADTVRLGRALTRRVARARALRIASANVPVDDATGGAGGGEGGYIVAGGFEPWQGRSSPGGSGIILGRRGASTCRSVRCGGRPARRARAVGVGRQHRRRLRLALSLALPSPEKASRNARRRRRHRQRQPGRAGLGEPALVDAALLHRRDDAGGRAEPRTRQRRAGRRPPPALIGRRPVPRVDTNYRFCHDAHCAARRRTWS